MTDLAQHFDEYARKARLYPALLVALPAGIAFALLWPGLSLQALLPVAATTGLPFFLGNAVRDRGKLLEKRLVKQWGGMPTTSMLRLSNPTTNPDQLRQRRDGLERLTGQPLPTAAEEQMNPRRSDERYIFATRTLIARARQHESRHPLIKTELTSYGFGRNMLALKPIAVVLLLVLLAIDGAAIALGGDSRTVTTTTVIHGLLLLGWSTVVRPSWVLRQGHNYAERVFEALLDPEIDATPPALPNPGASLSPSATERTENTSLRDRCRDH